MTTATASAAAVIRRARVILLDFDGPVCSIFAGLPARVVAAGLADVLTANGVPVRAALVEGGDPHEMLRYAGSLDPRAATYAERALRQAELEAADSAEPTPGAADFLAACHKTGRPVAVVSNNSGPAIARYLDRAGLAPLVAHIEARDPIDPALMKPHPALLNRALQALRARPDAAVVVGDSVTDVLAAKAAKVPTVGHANKPGKERVLRAAGADAVVERMTGLAELTARTPYDR